MDTLRNLEKLPKGSADDLKIPQYLQDWCKYADSVVPEARQKYLADITVIKSNAKIKQMSRRRQKIALLKRPKIVMTGCFPKSVVDKIHDGASTLSNCVDLEVTFSYETIKEIA